jgi:hypothetical protein
MNSTVGKPPFRGVRRINIGWKAQGLRLSRPKAQELRKIA